MAAKRRRKCDVCGLYVWGSQTHSGALHDRIRAARKGRLRRTLGRFVRRK